MQDDPYIVNRVRGKILYLQGNNGIPGASKFDSANEHFINKLLPVLSKRLKKEITKLNVQDW